MFSIGHDSRPPYSPIIRKNCSSPTKEVEALFIRQAGIIFAHHRSNIILFLVLFWEDIKGTILFLSLKLLKVVKYIFLAFHGNMNIVMNKLCEDIK